MTQEIARPGSSARLREGEEWLRLAVEAAGVALWEDDLRGGEGVWSKRLQEILGVGPDDPHTMSTFIERVHPDDRARVAALIDGVMDPAGSGHYATEYRVQRPDGAVSWVSDHGRVYFAGTGADRHVVRGLGAVIDITAEKEAEERLRQSLERDEFWVRLLDILRTLEDPAEIGAKACQVLGEHLGAARVLYADAVGEEAADVVGEYVDGVASVAGRHSVDAYGGWVAEALRCGETITIEDTGTDPRLSPDDRAVWRQAEIGAMIGANLVRDGRWVAGLAVHGATPRAWTLAEIALVEEAAERTWAAVERARAEQSLRESEERLRLAVEAAGIGLWDYNPRSEEGVWSERVREMLGVSVDSPYSLSTLIERIHPDDRDGLARVIQEATDPAGPGAYVTEYRVRRPDGAVRWISDRGRVYFGGTGADRRPVRALGVVADVTARKELQKQNEFRVRLLDKLRTSEDPTEIRAEACRLLGKHLAAARVLYAEAVDEKMVVVDGEYLDGVESMIGPHAVAAYGDWVSEALCRGQTIVVKDVGADPRISPDDRAAWEGNGIGAAVCAGLARDGRWIAGLAVHCTAPRVWSQLQTALVEEVAERTWAALERARAERSLRESEERLRLGIEAGSLALWDIDLVTGETTWSERFRRVLGVGPDHPQSTEAFLKVVHPDDVERVEGLIAASTDPRGDGEYQAEFRLVRPDGSVRWIADRGQVYFDGAGARRRPVRALGVLIDETERRRVQAEQQERERREREFVANAAHELLTPVAGIIGAVDSLQAGAMEDEHDRQRFLRNLQREASRMTRLSRGLLLLAATERADPGVREVIEVRGVLESIGSGLDLREGVRVVVVVPQSLTMTANRGLIEVAVGNLATNAARYTTEGTIELRAYRHEGVVVIEVRDTGSGMDATTVQRAFDRFYRGERRTEDGFGLGLALVWQAARALGAELDLDSSPDVGTVARLMIPEGETP